MMNSIIFWFIASLVIGCIASYFLGLNIIVAKGFDSGCILLMMFIIASFIIIIFILIKWYNYKVIEITGIPIEVIFLRASLEYDSLFDLNPKYVYKVKDIDNEISYVKTFIKDDSYLPKKGDNIKVMYYNDQLWLI